jgi:divalent metal cation (Fe/Co/Zn/Cd) transporter
MNLSVIFPLGILCSVAVGVGLIVFAISRFFGSKRHPAIGIAALLGAVVVNSWWLLIVLLVIYKLFVLREDT